tara:strand:- start:40660 stop:41616 length:957 start_codon:yes stop_codon:yes gene_type:complete
VRALSPLGEKNDIEDYLNTQKKEVIEALKSLFESTFSNPPLIIEAMQYSLFAGGKRFRPILTLASADTVEKSNKTKNRELAKPVACAIELIHTYSLVHDDLPAMDDDVLRRGRPTSHVKYGEGLAILAGDGLLTEAFRIVTELPHTNDPIINTRKLLVAKHLALAAGPLGMVGGQSIDLETSGQILERKNKLLDAEQLKSMHRLKTGALIHAAAVSGAIMVGASKEQVRCIEGYAYELGLGFQIIDDILDVEGVREKLGKTAGKDATLGKSTYPTFWGIEKSKRLATEAIEKAKSHLKEAALSGRLYEIADWVLSRSN